MQQNIRKEEFILLCDELEQGTINQNQFRILSDIKNPNQVKKILDIMKMKDLVNKNYQFGILTIFATSEYWFDLYCSIFDYSSYRKDVKRQDYIKNHLGDSGIHKIIELLQYDFYFEDEAFLTSIPVYSKENQKEYQSFINRVDVLYDDMKSVENSEFYKSEKVQKLVKKALLELNGHDSMKDLIKVMRLDGMLDRTIWFEYLIKIYNKNEKGYYPHTYNTLMEELIQNNRIDEVTKKIEEIDTSEKPEEEKIELASKFLGNIVSIRQDILESCSNEHFDFLLNQAMTNEIPFYHAKDMIDIAKDNHLSLSYISKFLKSLGRIENQNTRTVFMEVFKKYPNLINGFDFQKVEKSDYEGALAILTEEAIRQNHAEYIERGKKYFGETFSNDFIRYMSNKELTKKELLEIRDKVLQTSSSFDGNKRTFIVDTTSIVDMSVIEEIRLPEVIQPKIQVPTEVEEQQKGLWKRLSEKFGK